MKSNAKPTLNPKRNVMKTRKNAYTTRHEKQQLLICWTTKRNGKRTSHSRTHTHTHKSDVRMRIQMRTRTTLESIKPADINFYNIPWIVWIQKVTKSTFTRSNNTDRCSHMHVYIYIHNNACTTKPFYFIVATKMNFYSCNFIMKNISTHSAYIRKSRACSPIEWRRLFRMCGWLFYISYNMHT